MQVYDCEVRAVRWETISPGAKHAASKLIEITQAEPIVANALAEQLKKSGYSVSLVSQPQTQGAHVILTEGMTDRLMTDRHWAALVAARNARKTANAIILLQSSLADTGLEGLARTLRLEWPELKTSCWTLPPHALPQDAHMWLTSKTDDLWFDLEGQTSHPVLGPEISFRNIHDHAPQKSTTWLVTGGARGVTAACTVELARQAGGRFILAGRSALSSWPEGVPETNDIKSLRGMIASVSKERGEKRTLSDINKSASAALAGLEIRRTLSEIRKTGSEAEYIRMDTSDPASVRTSLDFISTRYDPVSGLIHGAGVIADRLVEDKSETELRYVFAPKADGLINLLNNLEQSHLRYIGLFSSASAFFGNRGQADYAMANSILANTGRTLSKSLPGARIKVFDWGPWEGGMVDDTLASHFKEQGIPLIPLAEGARIFATELLYAPREETELVIGTVWSPQ